MAQNYVEELVYELRLRDLPGTRIGEVVAEVEAHVAESGDDPTDTFGPAPQYAERVATAVSPVPFRLSWRDAAQVVGISAGGVLLSAGLTGLGWLGGDDVAAISVGTVVAVAVTVVAAVIGVRVMFRPARRPESRRQKVIRERMIPIGYLMAVPWLYLATFWALREPVLARFPAWWAVFGGLLLMVPLLALPELVPADPVIDPRTGRDRYGKRQNLLMGGVLLGLLALEIAFLLLLTMLTPAA